MGAADDRLDLDDLDDLDDEDFVFEPAPWDLAMVIGLMPDPAIDRPALDELADAMLVWADGPEVDSLTSEAVDVLWSGELEGQIRDGLARVAGLGAEWRTAAGEAAAELARDPQGAAVTHAVVQHLAMQLGSLDAPPLFCLCCIDELLAATPPPERRGRALEAAILAVRDARVPHDEVRAALARGAPGRLATDERRRAVRERLGRLGRLGRRSVPSLSAELVRVAAEPLPPEAAADDVWEVVAHALLVAVAKPDLN